MNTFYDYLLEAEHRRDDIVEAKKERLARQVSRLWQRWLVRLGERLVVWGCRLQSRYARGLDVSGTLQTEPGVKEANRAAGAG